MTTFTDKELIKEIKERIGSLDVRDNIERRAYEIALASLEADPVAYIFKHPAGKLFWALTDESNKEQPDVIPVYADSPAPVVPDEIDVNDVPRAVTYFKTHRDCYADGWSACRAAMLQGSQPVSQTYKFPVNTPCQDAPAHIWLQTAGVWPEDGELSELTWCSHNQHHDDTLYVRADLVNSNSPVTPDGWISCSERMPDTKTAVLVAKEFDRKGDWRMKWATYIPGHPDANDGWIIPGASWKPSHWMPLPEPPQEVNRG
ncbi:DUF551 domain-containing protein [Escherichia coli]|nr:DUF551 domain-containing protein [Escherichia coli]MBI1543925.1 DUF551 domain-containing protein [Escherichia coli]MBI1549264.1 DUF551 domain-containing protein [Escherichia coli]MBI1566020.1 DUF551 domain-containing protein [Escherichia coli]MBI1587096.1 DUF551 domain-containing protein [Escherichia coli]MBI1591619.1 DUF551 domain-containing protein [Escherichia coli]